MVKGHFSHAIFGENLSIITCMSAQNLSDVVSLAKRRGFVYAGSEIYGGLANTYDYGPLGVELLRNIKNSWWNFFISSRSNIVGMDSCILMNPKIWEASGHTENFADSMVDCKECQNRTRVDHLIEDYFDSINKSEKVEGYSLEKLQSIIDENKIKCPKCGKFNWTAVRKFNQLFETEVGIVTGAKNTAYLRGEIAQGMFVNFKNVLDSTRQKLPFGIGQSGAAFRNEITLGNFIFRTLQFNLSEFEFFFDSEHDSWENWFEYWKEEMWTWATKVVGLSAEKLRWRAHTDEERSHYSTRTEDLEYQFPFGFKEMFGLAYRTDYDLRNHTEKSGFDLKYQDPQDPSRKFIPHVIEPTFGMDRTLLALMCEAYSETQGEKSRMLMSFPAKMAPYKAAIFPLLANKPELVTKAKGIFDDLIKKYPVTFDDRGNIGKRYFYQDEAGTPFCITVDFQTLEDDTVTIRNRDTLEQIRLKIDELDTYLANQIA